MTDKLTLAVNHALNDARMARARMGLMAPTMGLDNKRHSAWCEYGFPEQVTYENLYALYRRGGIAHGAVEKLVGKCWQTNPEIIEGDDADESETKPHGKTSQSRYSTTGSGVHLPRRIAVALSVVMQASFCVRDEKTGTFRLPKGEGCRRFPWHGPDR